MRRILAIMPRLALALAVAWCGFAEVVQFFGHAFFGTNVAGDWFLMFLVSDGREVRTFFSNNAPAITLSLVILLSVGTLAALSVRFRRRQWRMMALAFALYVAQGLLRCGLPWTPLFLAYDTARGLRDYVTLVSAGRWTDADEREARAARAQPENGTQRSVVLVIGESMTTTRMGLYGYAKPTTPLLSALATNANALCVLPPRRAGSFYTAKALQEMLVRAGMSLAKRMRRRGYRTVLVSAQRHWERYSGVELMVFAACERKRYICDDVPDERCPDLRLTAYAEEEFAASGDQPLCLILHTIGSHFPFAERVPPDWATGMGLDDYDRSVLQTDRVLADLIRVVAGRADFVYTSDHGESPDSDHWRDSRDPALWSVPLLVSPASATNRVADLID